MKRIAIHSVPRSGSTWVGEIFNSNEKINYKYQPLFSYAFKGALTESTSLERIHNFFQKISNSDDEFINQSIERKLGRVPIFKKDHLYEVVAYKEVRYHHVLRNLLEKDSEIKVIGLVRSPLSVVNSWLKAPKEFRKDLGWKELDEWYFAPKKNQNKIEEYNGFEKWKEVANLFEELQQEYSNRFYLLKYDDLLNNTEIEVKKMFSFCGIEFTKQTSLFLSNSSKTDASNDAYSIYRINQADDKWKKNLDPRMVFKIQNELVNTKLEKYL